MNLDMCLAPTHAARGLRVAALRTIAANRERARRTALLRPYATRFGRGA